MTTGIGNPDWQRRYAFSAVAISDLTYQDTGNFTSPITDSNGYTYINVTFNTSNSSAFVRIVISWFQDAGASQSLGQVGWVVGPSQFVAQKIPVLTRYFTVQVQSVSGTTGGTVQGVVYGTSADTSNLLTQNTSTPLVWSNPSIAAGTSTTLSYTAMFGGPANVMIDDGGNNLWVGTLKYLDFSSGLYRSFWRVRGATVGQTCNQIAYFPYTPWQLQVDNNDTAAHTFIISVVGP